ncbi:MFS transporter [Undibacterium arcticum]
MPLSALFGASRVLVFASLLGAISIACVTFLDLNRLQLLLTIAAIGVGLLAGAIGQSALAVTLYPEAARATGVGYSAAVGRIGSILGPAMGGILLSLDRPAKEIILTACIPVLIAALAVGVLDFYLRRQY